MNSYTGQAMGGNELVSYAGDNLQVGNCCVPYPYYYPIYEQHYHNWYPLTTFITEKSKIEQSFKIVGKMLEKEIITKKLTIKEFIKLVNDIAEILLVNVQSKVDICCKYCHVSYGIGLSGEVEEYRVHCEYAPEIDYKETIKNGLRNIKNSHKSVLCRLPIAGCLDDGIIPCYTGCFDGNGKPEIVSINEKYIENIVDNKY